MVQKVKAHILWFLNSFSIYKNKFQVISNVTIQIFFTFIAFIIFKCNTKALVILTQNYILKYTIIKAAWIQENI